MAEASEEDWGKKQKMSVAREREVLALMETCPGERTSTKSWRKVDRERHTGQVVVTVWWQQQGCMEINLVLHGKPWHWNQTALWGTLWVSAQHRQVFNRQEEKILLALFFPFFFLVSLLWAAVEPVKGLSLVRPKQFLKRYGYKTGEQDLAPVKELSRV